MWRAPGKIEPILNISITDWQKEGGFAGYVVYRIVTKTNLPTFSSTEITVKRRYSEFEWLEERLRKFNPSLSLPALPPKRTLGRFRDDFLEQRRRGLQTFLNYCASEETLRNDPTLQLFCERPVELNDDSVSNELALLEKLHREQSRRSTTISLSGTSTGPVIDTDLFRRILCKVRDSPFPSSRLGLIADVAAFAFSVDQVCAIMGVLPFSSERISAARILAPLLSNPRNSRRIAGYLRFEHERGTVRELLDTVEAHHALCQTTSQQASIPQVSTLTSAPLLPPQRLQPGQRKREGL